MALGDNPVIPLYEPGERFSARVTAAVTHGTFVAPSGNFEGGPLLDVSAPTSPLTGGNLPKVATCGAGAKAIGVAGFDAVADGDVIPVINGPGIVVPMTAGAAITAGQQVESNAAGNPIPWGGTIATQPNGIAISGAANGATVYVRLYT
jgi:Uncharacterized conserved protein (DUF2190)